MRAAANLFFCVFCVAAHRLLHRSVSHLAHFHNFRHQVTLTGYAFCRSQRPQREAEEQRSNELLVHPDIGGVADAEGVFELVEGRAAPQKPDGEGVAEDHR